MIIWLNKHRIITMIIIVALFFGGLILKSQYNKQIQKSYLQGILKVFRTAQEQGRAEIIINGEKIILILKQ